jgi:prephenate dehydrogenase
MLAVTSHLPHVLASALMRQAAETQADYRQTQQLSAGSFADATRVAASSPKLWRDVCLTNREAILTSLQGFRGQLDTLEEAVDSSDAERLEEFFAVGAFEKSRWGRL